MRKKSRDSTSRGESTAHPTEKESGRTKQRYMTPKEVYNELRKVWKNEQDLVRVMFGNDSHSNSFTMFFINAVFVPPSRFRPESKLGEEKYLHDHTAILARILETNNDLKGILVKQFNEKDKELNKADRELDNNRFHVQKDLTQTKMIDFKKTHFYGQALRRLKG
jgi:DNA-directed RNA polymerase I subunit RPA1